MTERRKLDWRQVAIAVLTALIAALGGGGTVIGWQGCNPPAPPIVGPPPTEPPPEQPPVTDPREAVGKLLLQSSFCSATAIGPRRGDGRWNMVSAAHCFRGGPGVGRRGQYVTRSGVSIPVTCVAIDETADIAILITDERYEKIEYVMVAENTPQIGTSIQHHGFGQHIPGNTEQGQVLAAPNQQGQVRYRLSVSPGDSGGGILTTAGGMLLSPVCCTTCLGCVGDVWGGSPERIRRMVSNPTLYIDLPPAVMPPPPKS